MAFGFLKKLFAFFFGSRESRSKQQNQIKQLAKDLKSSRYARFYRAKTEEVTPALGKFFFDIYRLLVPAQSYLQNAEKSSLLKLTVAEVVLDPLEDIWQWFSAEAIEERAKSMEMEELSRSLEYDFNDLSALFTVERVTAINRCYAGIMSIVSLASFDYFSLLKKLDPIITEHNFTYQPKFTNFRGAYITDDLKDFIAVSYEMEPDYDWRKALQALKLYRAGIEMMPYEQWYKLINLLHDVRRSGILELIVRHIDKDPSWLFKPKPRNWHITDAYLEIKRAEVKETLKKIAAGRKKARLNELAKAVFGNAEIKRAEYYTEQAGEIYVQKDYKGFVHSAGFNYLKVFLLDHVKTELRQLYDLLVIRGRWTQQDISQEASEYFHRLLELADRVEAFDLSLAGSGELGARLGAALPLAGRNKTHARAVTIVLESANEEARELLAAAVPSLTVLGRTFMTLQEDIQKPTPELLMNWKELEFLSATPLALRVANAYIKINLFSQMIPLFIKLPGDQGTAD
jgi:hypothetical protein